MKKLLSLILVLVSLQGLGQKKDSGLYIQLDTSYRKADTVHFYDGATYNGSALTLTRPSTEWKSDTVQVFLLVSDTATYYMGGVAVYDDRPRVLEGWQVLTRKQFFYGHSEYLGPDKEPLRKRYIVWFVTYREQKEEWQTPWMGTIENRKMQGVTQQKFNSYSKAD